MFGIEVLSFGWFKPIESAVIDTNYQKSDIAMAKGQRGAKGGQSTATAANGPNNRTKAGDREDHQNSQSVKGQRNQRTNRTNKKEMIVSLFFKSNLRESFYRICVATSLMIIKDLG